MNDQCKGMDKVPPSQSSSSFYVNFCVITIKKKKKNFGIIAWYQSPTVEWFFLQTSPSFSKERILVSANKSYSSSFNFRHLLFRLWRHKGERAFIVPSSPQQCNLSQVSLALTVWILALSASGQHLWHLGDLSIWLIWSLSAYGWLI